MDWEFGKTWYVIRVIIKCYIIVYYSIAVWIYYVDYRVWIQSNYKESHMKRDKSSWVCVTLSFCVQNPFYESIRLNLCDEIDLCEILRLRDKQKTILQISTVNRSVQVCKLIVKV